MRYMLLRTLSNFKLITFFNGIESNITMYGILKRNVQKKFKIIIQCIILIKFRAA